MKPTPIKENPNISFAVPVCNEGTVVDDLIRRVATVLRSQPGNHQLVVVDDGSTDETFDKLTEHQQRIVDELRVESVQSESSNADDSTLASGRFRLDVISLSRNFGHQAAISCALDHCDGDVVLVMDGDLQDTPESLPQFIEAYQQGHDVVYAIRSRRSEPLWLRTLYACHYRLLASLADIHLPLDAGDFALLSRRVVDLIRQSPERQRYLRGLRSWYGFSQVGIPVDRLARHSGRSKYNLRRLVRLAFDGIFAFSIVPLRLAVVGGLAAVTISILYAIYALYVRLLLPTSEQAPPGFTALILAITFLSGCQLLFMGIIGEYIGRIYEEIKQRPHYVVDRLIRSTPRA